MELARLSRDSVLDATKPRLDTTKPRLDATKDRLDATKRQLDATKVLSTATKPNSVYSLTRRPRLSLVQPNSSNSIPSINSIPRIQFNHNRESQLRNRGTA